MKNRLSKLFLILFIFGLSSCNTSESVPKGWRKTGSEPDKYIVGIDAEIFSSGSSSVFIESKSEGTSYKFTEGSTAGIRQTCSAKNYLGKRIKMSGKYKVSNLNGMAGIYIKIDSENPIYIFTMAENKDWATGSVSMYIPLNTKTISFGGDLLGTGKMWIDKIQFEINEKKEGDKEPEKKKEKKSETNSGIKPHDKPMNLDFED